MKKFLLAIVIAASLACAIPAEAQEKPVDLIVLLDASQSMFPYFTEVIDFVVSRIAREYLRFGDTFHLLTFTDTAQIEIAQPVRTEQDIKSLLGRLYLLYPLGKTTDLVSALASLYTYTSDLPESNRKLIIMITDGMHNPSPKSPYAGLNTQEVRSKIDQIASKIRENGWVIRIIRVPFTNGSAVSSPAGSTAAGGASSGQAGSPSETLGSSPGAGDYLSDMATGLGASVTDFSSEDKEDAAALSVEMPRATFPGNLGKVDYDFAFPLVLFNPSARSLRLELSGAYSDERNLLTKNIFLDIPSKSDRTFQIPITLSDTVQPGKTSLDIELRFADGIRVVPTTGTLTFELVNKPFSRLFRTTGRIVLFLTLLVIFLALIILVIVYVRNLHRRSEQPLVAAVLDSEAASAAERREVLARARDRAPDALRVTADEARSIAENLLPKHVTDQEAQAYRADLTPKYVTSAEAQAFQTDLTPKHVTDEEALSFQISPSQRRITEEEARIFGEKQASITDEEAKFFHSSRSVTTEEAARYRDGTARGAADALAAYAAAISPNRMPSDLAASKPVSFIPTVKCTGSLRVVFRVEDQNPNIGLRNVLTLHSGGKKTVGGKRSDFLVFLVPVPPRIAEIYFDGEDLTLIPLKPEYFPDYSGPITGCLGSTVKMVTRRGRILNLSFELYVPPADRLNRILHCIDSPGFPVVGAESKQQKD